MNSDYCKSYYQRIKQDPVKWKAFLGKRAQYKRSRKSVNPVNPPTESVNPSVNPMARPVKQPVNPPTGGKHSASKTQGDVGLSADELLAVWQELFDKQDLELERDAIREFGGG